MHSIHQIFPSLIAIICLYFPFFYNTCSAEALSYRLPSNLHPEYYQVSILTNLADLNQNYTFSGRVWIQIKCDEPTNKIVLHSKNLEVERNTVVVMYHSIPVYDAETETKRDYPGESDKILRITNQQCQEDYDFYTITLAEEMRPGLTYSVLINYSGELNQGLVGYYRSSYKDRKTGETRWLAVTQFESTDARRALPCFDEPAFKARFEVRLGHINYRTSISNMRITDTIPVDNMPEWVWDQYETTVPMSTYLLAFVVSDFNFKISPKATSNDVTFRVWARNDAINQVDYAAFIGPSVLEQFERYFRVKYPLPKLDMIAIPDFGAGAMENWGLITYREVALLYDPAVSTASSQPYIASVIAHEIAHQWFGNLVTMKWWTDLWLNEGFATYVAALGVNYLHPEWDSLTEEVVDNAMSVFSLDSLKSSHPISVPIGHPKEIDQIFDTISYKKGSFVLRMMNLFLGEETFRTGVSNYLKRHAFSNAEQNDLWECLTTVAHNNQALPGALTVKEIMDTWTLQTGYPLITVTRNYETGDIYVSQERYLADRGTQAKDLNQSVQSGCKWWVPLSYTSKGESDFECTRPKEWLASNQNSIVIQGVPKDDWVIFNIQISGLYKVKYDIENWNRLIRTLCTGHKSIAMLNRVLLIEDSLEFAKSGDIDYTIPFGILRYLQDEEEYLPWKAALRNLGYVDKMLKLYSTYGYFTAFVNNLIRGIYEKISHYEYENTPENLIKIKHQSLISSWACRVGVGNCREKAISAFKEYMEKGAPVPKDSQSYVYCTAIRYGGEKEWNFLWNQYLKSNVGNERSLILLSLSCTREIWLLNRYLEWSIDENSGVRKQDSPSVFAGIARSEIGYFLAKAFCKTKLQKIANYFGPRTTKVGNYFGVLASQITTLVDYEELTKFVDSNKDIFHSSMQAVQQGLENAKINIQWQQKFYHDISRYLRAEIMGNQKIHLQLVK